MYPFCELVMQCSRRVETTVGENKGPEQSNYATYKPLFIFNGGILKNHYSDDSLF